MNKLLNKKITILLFFLFLSLGLISFIFFGFNYNQNRINAQEIVCDPQIPIGEAVEKTTELLEMLSENFDNIEKNIKIQTGGADIIIDRFTPPFPTYRNTAIPLDCTLNHCLAKMCDFVLPDDVCPGCCTFYGSYGQRCIPPNPCPSLYVNPNEYTQQEDPGFTTVKGELSIYNSKLFTVLGELNSADTVTEKTTALNNALTIIEEIAESANTGDMVLTGVLARAAEAVDKADSILEKDEGGKFNTAKQAFFNNVSLYLVSRKIFISDKANFESTGLNADFITAKTSFEDVWQKFRDIQISFAQVENNFNLQAKQVASKGTIYTVSNKSYKEIEKSQKEIKKAVEEKSETIDPDILSSSELQILENSFNTIIQPIPGLGGFSSFSELFPHLYVDYKWAVDLIDSALGGIFKITKEEFIKRKLNKARLEFDRCHLTPLEWKKVEQGKLSPRYTTRCRTVLETNLPRKIDAVCETTCLLMGANSDECKKCTSCKSLLNYFCCQ